MVVLEMVHSLLTVRTRLDTKPIIKQNEQIRLKKKT